MSAAVSFRTLLVTLTDKTLTDGTFSSYSYFAFNGATQTDTRTGLTTNAVIYNGGALTTADKIRFTMVSGNTYDKLCFDGVIATRDHYINDKVNFSTATSSFSVASQSQVTSSASTSLAQAPYKSTWE